MWLTVVMYHYVRERTCRRFPALNVLSVGEFREQLTYLDRFYQFVSVRQCIAALGGEQLPANSVLLTFDDGLKEHFTHVFPILRERGIVGLFSPPAKPLLEHKVLDAHKLQFILASGIKSAELLSTILDRAGLESYPASLAFSRFDGREVATIKALLQQQIPLPQRAFIVDELFRKHVTQDEGTFADELYVSMNDLREMRQHGMEVGAHGWDHRRLGTLDEEGQSQEIVRSKTLLTQLGVPEKEWSICYPHGSHDSTTLRLVKNHGGALGFTTKLGRARLSPANALTLERLDTNDLPKDGLAPPNKWTSLILQEQISCE